MVNPRDIAGERKKKKLGKAYDEYNKDEMEKYRDTNAVNPTQGGQQMT